MKNKVYVFAAKVNGTAQELSPTLLELALVRFFDRIGAEPEKVTKLPSGKPVFEKPGLFLSVSHSESVYLCAFARVPVGADIEKRRRTHERVKENFFSEQEKKEDFYSVWTGKEAVSKIGGEGLSALSGIEVCGDRALFAGREYALSHLPEMKLSGYSAAVAVPGDAPEIEVL